MRATKKPPGGRLGEHVDGPRALVNDDDGGEVAAHRQLFNRSDLFESNIARREFSSPKRCAIAANWGHPCARSCVRTVDDGQILGIDEKFRG
jgi:hypothetical protein